MDDEVYVREVLRELTASSNVCLRWHFILVCH